MESPTLWEIVQLPLLVTAVPLCIKGVQWLISRRDSKPITSMSLWERQQAAVAAERESLNKGQRDYIERVEGERDRALERLERLQIKLEDVEDDRDRGWDLVRWWFRSARELFQALMNARAMVGVLTGRLDPPQRAPDWEVFAPPLDMEAPIPRPPARLR